LRATFWLGLLSLFVPGSLPFGMITASHVDGVVERPTQDTLTPVDRVASWRGPRGKDSPLQSRLVLSTSDDVTRVTNRQQSPR